MEIVQKDEDLLTAEEFYVRVSAGKRLANYVIDLVLFYILILIFGFTIALISPSSIDSIPSYSSPGYRLLDRFISLLMYAIYMSIVEALFKGKSLGKLITKTRAVNLDGTPISVGTAFGRGFSRAVPFCVFSAFGTPCDPWQDKWTNTMVVEDSK